MSKISRIAFAESEKLRKSITKEIPLYKNWYWNCPLFIRLTHDDLEEYKSKQGYMDQFIGKSLDTEHILSEIWFYNHVSEIYTNELLKHINTFTQVFLYKQNEANLEGKKLLVILSESHRSSHSYLLELMILTILKSYKFNSLLVERNQQYLEKYLTEKHQFMQTDEFANSILKFKLSGIDPYNDSDDYNKRDKGIAKEVLKHNKDNQILLIGAMHLKPLISNPHIQKNYATLSISVRQDVNKFHDSLQLEYNNAKDKWYMMHLINNKNHKTSDTIELSFSTIIEGFSINELYKVYIDFLPELLGLQPEKHPKKFFYKPQDHYDKCQYYLSFEDKMSVLNNNKESDYHHYEL